MVSAFQELAQTVVACRLCPRLVRYREHIAHVKKREFADWTYWGRPVPGFGDPRARLLIVGLAPAAHGANRTGRMFTGDSSGRWLFRALHRAGFASQASSEHRNDGLRLHNVYITATVRCAPPGNKPTRHEIANCSRYFRRELDLLKHTKIMVVLGQIAFVHVLRVLTERGFQFPRPRPRFAHGASCVLRAASGETLQVISSYHPSRQNTQTGRLTEKMLDAIFAAAKRGLAARD